MKVGASVDLDLLGVALPTLPTCSLMLPHRQFLQIIMSDTNIETERGEILLVNDEEVSPTTTPAARPYRKSWDVVELVACVVFLFLGMIPEVFFKSPRERPIPFQFIQSGEYILNLAVNEQFDSDTISDVELGLLSVLLPLVLQLALAFFLLKQHPKGLHNTLCTYLVGFGLTFLVTSVVKVYVGYLRPSFYDLCEPTSDFTSCTGDDSVESRLSFPSGHASIAFCGLPLLSKYLERAFGLTSITERVTDVDGSVVLRFKATQVAPQIRRLFSILCLLPYALAIFIATSRIVDNKHHPADVVGGSVLGAACAHFAHQLWFPSL